MKKLIIVIVIGIFLGFSFVNPEEDISPKVIEAFNKNFSDVKNIKWFEGENGCTVTFSQNDIQTRIDYDEEGHFLSSVRYYGENKLPFDIFLKIKEKYKGKVIKVVTELVEPTGVTYSINVEDEENVYLVQTTTSSTSLTLMRKFKKKNDD